MSKLAQYLVTGSGRDRALAVLASGCELVLVALFGLLLAHAIWFIALGTASLSSAVEIAAIPESRLNLVVRGIRTGQAAADGVAFLQTPDGRDGIFRPGDEIVDGVTLHSLDEERIIIDRRGRLPRRRWRRQPAAREDGRPVTSSASNRCSRAGS